MHYQGDQRQAERVTPAFRIKVNTITMISQPYVASIECSPLDVSAHGIKLALDHCMPKGYVLDMLVEVEAENRPFRLVGKVRWVHSRDGGQRHLHGLEFCEHGCHDLERWRQMLARRVHQSPVSVQSGKQHYAVN
ncbi:MAG: PilZ domain-containing protein [Gammaproteobacteria bacterium]|jgi:hypothetical protein